jgi:hypothetical protein
LHPIGTERFNKVSAPKPLTATASSTPGCVLGQRALARIQQSPWRQVFKPLAAGIIGLVIAVALWGFSYKLSLYHRHQTPSSQIPVAKLWIESRNASVLAASRPDVKSHLIHFSQAFPEPVQRFPRLGHAVACPLPECRRGDLVFNSQIPSRSPPPYRFRLA